MLENSRVAAQLVSSQEGLRSMELFQYLSICGQTVKQADGDGTLTAGQNTAKVPHEGVIFGRSARIAVRFPSAMAPAAHVQTKCPCDGKKSL
jgi:hypothetical protein